MKLGLVRGVALVVRQEFRIRLRTGRWQWLLGSWFVVVGLFTGLLVAAMVAGTDNTDRLGPPLFGALMLFVLALIMVVSPAITAQSINGDRERGTLATLQVTRLSAAEIAIGKLLAGWAVGLTALALTIPYVGFSILLGGVGIVRAAVVLAVVAILIGVVCAVCQALSALLSRSITSALLSYVMVFALTIGTPIAFTLGMALTQDGYQSRPDRVWWMIAPNPFVVLADAAPRHPPRWDPTTGEYEPRDLDLLGEMGRGMRQLRVPPPEPRRYGEVDPSYIDSYEDRYRRAEDYPVWPYGLGFNLLLGAGSLAITIARLRTPSRRLARGQRVA